MYVLIMLIHFSFVKYLKSVHEARDDPKPRKKNRELDTGALFEENITPIFHIIEKFEGIIHYESLKEKLYLNLWRFLTQDHHSVLTSF